MNIEYFASNYGVNSWGDYRNALSPMSGARWEAVQAAISWVGTRNYSLFTTKGNQATTYCSLMIYAAYKKASETLRTAMIWKYHPGGWLSTLNIDLDSDGGLFVFPRDILQSNWVGQPFALSDLRQHGGGGGGGGTGSGPGQHTPVIAQEPMQWPVRRD
jgi:hypothetical protein